MSRSSRLSSGHRTAPRIRRGAILEQLEQRLVFAAFTPGDIAVVRVGDGSGTLTNASNPVFIDEYTPAGSLVQSIALPTTDSAPQHALTMSGTASSEGELNLSTNGQFLMLAGYDTAPGLASVSSTLSTTVARTVGEIGVDGTIDTTTALTDFASGNNVRAATSTDGVNVWLAGADATTGGVRYIDGLGGTTSTNLTGSLLKNVRDVQVYNGQLYIASDKTAQVISTFGTLPTSGTPPYTGLNGTDLATGSNSATNSFYFARLGVGATDNGYDTLYIADSSGTVTNATPGITKYSFDGVNWVNTGSIGGTTAYFGLTGKVVGGNVQLYTTTTNGIFSINDTSGYGGTLAAAITPIATADSNTMIHGVAFVPELPAVHFSVSAPASVTAGSTFSVTVSALDSSNSVVTGYTGTVQFTTSDTGAGVVLPGNYTFTAGDHGVHTFTGLKLVTAPSQTVTATDTSAGGFGTATITVNAAALNHLGVMAPLDSTALKPFDITVAAQDQYGNTVTSYTGTVHFTKSDGGGGSAVPGDYTFTAGDQGIHTFANGVTLASAGNQTISATDSVHGVNGSATVADYVVHPFTAGNFVVYRVGIGGSYNITGDSAPVFLDEYTPAGTLVQSVPMPVVDNGANHALTAAGNATSEGQLTLSPNGAYLALGGYDAVLGTQIVSNTSSTTVPRTVAVVDPSGSVDSSTTLSNFASGNNIRGAITTDGNSLWVTGGNSGVGYTTLGSTTATTIDPSDEQNLRGISIVDGQLYVSSQKSVRLATVGDGVPTAPSQTLTNLPPDVPDNTSTQTPNGFFFADVSPAIPGADTLYLTDDNAGQILKFSLDAGNWDLDGVIDAPSVRGLTGVVSGSTVTLYATTSGLDGESGTLYKYTDTTGFGGAAFGSASYLVTAPTNEAFRGVAIVPQTPVATHFVITTPSSVTAGSPFSITVTAEDAGNNVVTGFTGLVHFTTSDPNLSAMVPADYTFVAGDHGVHTFTNMTTLDTAGSQSIDAGGTIFGSATLTVTPAAANHFDVTAPVGATHGAPFDITVTARDNYGNAATGYTGTVHFTKTDSGGGSAVPGNYTFVAGDNGVHTFAGGVTFVTGHSQTVTATDTSTSINGSATVTVIQPFTAGDVVVYRVGAGVDVLNGHATAVYLDEYSPAGTIVQSIPLPVTSTPGGNQALLASGTASSEGQLTTSSDGAYLVFTGYDSVLDTSNVSSSSSSSVPRTVGLIDLSGAIDTTTALTDASSGNNVRSAASSNGHDLWVVGGTGGVAYATRGSTTSTALDPTGEQNLREVDVVDGQLYASSQKTLVLAGVGSGLPTTAPQTLTNLPGLPSPGNAVNANGYFLAKVNPASSGVDTLYITDQVAGGGAGQVDKYALVSGSWVARGSIAVGVGASGLTGSVNGSNVTLYITSSGSTSIEGTIYKFTDNTGYNGTVSGTASVLATAAINEAFRGVALAPTTVAVSDVDAPVFDLNGAAAGTSYTTSWSNAGAVYVTDAAATVTDADTANLASLTVAMASPQAGDTLTADNSAHPAIAVSFASNTLTLSGSAPQADYTDILRTIQYNNTSPPLSGNTVVLNFSASDGTLTSTTEHTTIDVAPVLDLNGAAAGTSFTSSWGGFAAIPVAITDATNATVSDAGATNLSMLTAALTAPNAGDTLSANNSAHTGIAWSFSGNTLTLSGSDTVANYQAVLRTIKYTNSSGGPHVDSLTVDLQAFDGAIGSNVAVATVTFPPVLDLNGGGAGTGNTTNWFNSGATNLNDTTAATAIAPSGIANLSGMTVVLSSFHTGDVLAMPAIGGISGLSTSYSSGTLSITGSQTVANYQKELRLLSYNNTAGGPGVSSLTATVTATDGTLTSVPAVSTINVSVAAGQVLGNRLFYNGSKYDGNNTAINSVSDALAIAPDKIGYVGSASSSTFANVSTFTKGITGVMVDLQSGIGAHASITTADITFKVSPAFSGTYNNVGTWTTATAPAAFSVILGGGTGGSDRVEITWNVNAIRNEWLEVNVAADANTGLSSPDIFFFGNAAGDSGEGNSATQITVNATRR